jgi:hypothetical protein
LSETIARQRKVEFLNQTAALRDIDLAEAIFVLLDDVGEQQR